MRVSTLLMLAAVPAANASPYGCTVLLCLSNPAGPQAVAECVDPISRLRHDLRRGRPFPSCEEAQGGAFAAVVTIPYEDCPQGSRSLAAGAYAIPQAALPANTAQTVHYSTGIGDGQPINSSSDTVLDNLPPKVCVGNRTGAIQVQDQDQAYSGTALRTVDVYDQVQELAARPEIIGRIRIVVNGSLYRYVGVD